MNARLESMSHGDGKVYLQMVLDRIQADAAVLLEARLKNGTKVPAHLFPFHPLESASQANYVVVLPHLDVREVDLTFFEYSGEGAPLSQSHLTVELNMVKWKTRFNALVHNELITQMFDIEREYSADRITVYFTDAIEDGDEIVVRMLVDMPQIDGVDVMVDFTDRAGDELDLAVYPLLDESDAPTGVGDNGRLRLGFAVRVRAAAKDFCVTVYDGNEVLPGGFALFCDETYEPLHETFRYYCTDAEHDEAYAEWYQRSCKTLAELALQKRTTLPHQPLVSLVLPVAAGDECYLAATMRALHQQTYEHFEVVLVDVGLSDFAYSSATREWEDDARLIHLTLDKETDGAAARLTGMLQSSGEACAVLDPRIILAPEALFEFVRAINEAQDAGQARDVAQSWGMVYAHHDFFDREKGLHSPAIKPVYSPDLLYSYDYMGPLVVFSRQLINDISEGEGFASESFEYDLALKAAARTSSIQRVDALLYHVQDSACISASADKVRATREEEAFRGGRKALANAFRRAGVEAVVLADVATRRYRVQYRLPEDVSLSVVLLGNGDVGQIEACLASLEAGDELRGYEVVVVDQPTAHDVSDWCAFAASNRGNVRFVGCPARDFAKRANAAAAACTSEYALFLDADAELLGTEGISTLLGHCMREGVGAVGAKLLFTDDTIHHAGMMVGPGGTADNIGTNLPRTALGYQRRFVCSQNLSAVSGAVMMVRLAAFNEVGGFDERFSMGLYDADLCLKLYKASYFVAYNGDVEFYHQRTSPSDRALSRSQRIRLERERAFFRYRWPKYFIDGDPFMSTCFDSDMPYYHLSPLV